MAANPGDHYAVTGAGGADSSYSTPFVSAPSSPARDPSFHTLAAAGFYSAPASPARGGPGADDEYGFDFDFSSQFPCPAWTPMSSADELFHNGQIRPMRLASFLFRPQALPPLAGELPAPHRPEVAPSVHRRSRSHSPFRLHCLSPAANSGAPSASRSSSSSSSSSRRHHRRWWFLKVLIHHRSNPNGGSNHHHPPPNSHPPPPACKRNPSPAATSGRGRTTHARLYETRRAEAEEMRRRTFLPYRQGLLLGCLGLSSWGCGAMHGLAAAAVAKSRA